MRGNLGFGGGGGVQSASIHLGIRPPLHCSLTGGTSQSAFLAASKYLLSFASLVFLMAWYVWTGAAAPDSSSGPLLMPSWLDFPAE
eukprot:Skav220162  [mRNA]  locus=scaffold564:238754:250563:+ [translate_table: standard]